MSTPVPSDEALDLLRPFVSVRQWQVIRQGCQGEEGGFFQAMVLALTDRIENMPKTYEQDGKGDDALAYLHYFCAGCDWYITEKDIDGGIQQAFGLAILNGDQANAELGCICIGELVLHEVELDLYFEPTPLAVVRCQAGAGRNRA